VVKDYIKACPLEPTDILIDVYIFVGREQLFCCMGSSIHILTVLAIIGLLFYSADLFDLKMSQRLGTLEIGERKTSIWIWLGT
jgi:hypothetical protein